MEKTGGRKKGVQNKTSAEIREVSAALLQGELETLKRTVTYIETRPVLKSNSNAL